MFRTEMSLISIRVRTYRDFFTFLQKVNTCNSCEELKEKLREQQECHALKIRELDACIRDLKCEKESLEQKVANERRSSEEFTSRVQQIVQKLETEQRASKRSKEEPIGEKMRETETFFNMVKRFFTEHETLRDYVKNCLRDLHQLQRYFQVGCHRLRKEELTIMLTTFVPDVTEAKIQD